MRTDQRSADWRAGRRSEVMTCYRFACQRLARSMFIKVSPKSVRILAKIIESEGLRMACIKADEFAKGKPNEKHDETI